MQDLRSLYTSTHRAAQRSVTLGHRQRKRTSVLTKYIGCCYANKATEGAKWDGAHLAMGEPHLLPVRQLCAPTEPLLPFCSAHHGDGFTPVLLAGHRMG